MNYPSFKPMLSHHNTSTISVDTINDCLTYLPYFVSDDVTAHYDVWSVACICAGTIAAIFYVLVIFATIVIASALAPLFPACRDFFATYLFAYALSEGFLPSAYHSRPMFSTAWSQLRLGSTLEFIVTAVSK